MREFNKLVVDEAKNWIGTTEVSGNKGFLDSRFETIMKQVGWNISQAWCSYFCELCWTLPTYSSKSKYLQKMWDLFSGGAVATYNNFKKDKSGLFSVDRVPKPGSVMIMQKYKNGEPHWSGHAGIVVEVGDNEIKTVEGNTNASGGREGIEVALKTRSLIFEGDNGLVLKGFIKLNG